MFSNSFLFTLRTFFFFSFSNSFLLRKKISFWKSQTVKLHSAATASGYFARTSCRPTLLPSFTLSLSLFHTHRHIDTQIQTYKHTHKHTFFLSHTYKLSHARTHTHINSLSVALWSRVSDWHPWFLSLSLSHFLSFFFQYVDSLFLLLSFNAEYNYICVSFSLDSLGVCLSNFTFYFKLFWFFAPDWVWVRSLSYSSLLKAWYF